MKSESLESFQEVLLPTTREPIQVVAGKGPYIDIVHEGERRNDVIDAVSQVGTNPLGHRPEPLLRAIRPLYEEGADIPLMMDGQGYYHPYQADLAETFTRLFPGDLARGDLKTYFCNSGSEAMERGCLKAAALHRGGNSFIGMEGAFHGRTTLALAHTNSKGWYREGFRFLPRTLDVPFATETGGEILEDPDENARACLDRLVTRIDREGPDNVNAITLEPLQGEGGYNVPHPEFIRGVRGIAADHGIPMISDEVQASIRTGTWFGIEQFDVQPDMIAVAKAFSGGITPFGASLIRDGYATEHSGKHSGTFGGNAKECFIALKTIEIIEENDYLDNAREQGSYLGARFDELAEKHDIIHEARGRGLFRGIEIREDGEAAPDLRDRIIHRLLTDHDILVESCGNDQDNTAIRFLLPVNIDREPIERIAEAVESVVRDLS